MTIIAWRHWRVYSADGALHSASQRTVWEPHAPVVAECLRHSSGLCHHASPAPSWACSCGIHAWKTRDDCLRYAMQSSYWFSSKRAVVGRVELAGRVITHEKGYRAGWASIYDLFVPDHLAEVYPDLEANLRRMYGVDVDSLREAA